MRGNRVCIESPGSTYVWNQIGGNWIKLKWSTWKSPNLAPFGQGVQGAVPQPDGSMCITKTKYIEKMEKKPVKECWHQNVTTCHDTYVTEFRPNQEQVCFFQVCPEEKSIAKDRVKTRKISNQGQNVSYLWLNFPQDLLRTVRELGMLE